MAPSSEEPRAFLMKYLTQLLATLLLTPVSVLANPYAEALPWANANPYAGAAAEAYADAYAEAIAIAHPDPEAYALAASADDCATISCHASCGMLIIYGSDCSTNTSDTYAGPYNTTCLCSEGSDFLSSYPGCMDCGWTLWKYYGGYVSSALAACKTLSTEPTGTSRCSTTLTDSYTIDTNIQGCDYTGGCSSTASSSIASSASLTSSASAASHSESSSSSSASSATAVASQVWNSTNTSSSGVSNHSSTANIKLYSFSDEFTALYSNNTTGESYSNVTLTKILNDFGVNASQISAYNEIKNVSTSQLNSTYFFELYHELKSDIEDDIDGAIIAVGSQYLEDLAFFLDLLLNTSIPVVLIPEVTAQNLISSGAENLASAIIVSSDKEAIGRGTLVLNGNSITSGFYFQDTSSIPQGIIGKVYEGKAQWFYSPSDIPTNDLVFDISDADSLPEVPIIYSYNGFSSEIITELGNSNEVEGLVLVNTQSTGSFTPSTIKAIEKFAEDVPVVISTQNFGLVVSEEDVSTIEGTVGAGILDPVKARILLQVSIAAEFNTTEIEQVFSTVYGG